MSELNQHPGFAPLPRCPMLQVDDGSWVVRSHALVKQVAEDAASFSNAASRYRQVPNGMDGAEHTQYRDLIDQYLTSERVALLEPTLHRIASEVIDVELARGPAIDAVQLGLRYAVRAACAWLGWSRELEPELDRWVGHHWEATHSGELTRTQEVAQWYQRIVGSELERRRAWAQPGDDLTSELMADRTLGHPLTDADIISILRNWTGGDLGTMALCTGVVLAYCADHLPLQEELRVGASDQRWALVLDEILRLDDPFVSNRRVATKPTEIAGVSLSKGERLRLDWRVANTDPQVFGSSNDFDPERNAAQNLVYGVGKHVCPGRELATVQLRILVQEVLERTSRVSPHLAMARRRSNPPAGGFSRVPLVCVPPISPGVRRSPQG